MNCDFDAFLDSIGAERVTVDDRSIVASFGNTEAEVAAVRRSSGVHVLGDREAFEVVGKDRARFLHGQTTNDIKGLAPGRGAEVVHLTPKGKMFGMATVLCESERFLLVADRPYGSTLVERLRKFIIMDDVKIRPIADPAPQFYLGGPDATAIIRAVFKIDVAGLAPRAHGLHESPHGSIRIVGNADAGLFGIELWTDPSRARDAFAACVAAGARPVGDRAFEILRIESGRPRFSIDMNDENLPNEARLEHAISYTKGCYVGQEIIARLRTYGQVAKILVGLECDTPIQPGTQLQNATGTIVGRVGSAVFSPTVAKEIGIAIVRREAAESRELLTGVFNDRATTIRIVDLPFCPATYGP
jgi:folate-binding protein YgfZ